MKLKINKMIKIINLNILYEKILPNFIQGENYQKIPIQIYLIYLQYSDNLTIKLINQYFQIK